MQSQHWTLARGASRLEERHDRAAAAYRLRLETAGVAVGGSATATPLTSTRRPSLSIRIVSKSVKDNTRACTHTLYDLTAPPRRAAQFHAS